jgi:hypothetical protein
MSGLRHDNGVQDAVMNFAGLLDALAGYLLTVIPSEDRLLIKDGNLLDGETREAVKQYRARLMQYVWNVGKLARGSVKYDVKRCPACPELGKPPVAWIDGVEILCTHKCPPGQQVSLRVPPSDWTAHAMQADS